MTYEGGYRSPRLRDIVLAIIIAIAALVAFLKLGDLVKLAGAPLGVLPSALGFVRAVSADGVRRYNLATMPDLVEFLEPGRYAVYTGDYDLLLINTQVREAGTDPWMVITSERTGQRVPAAYVTRGMRPYDTPLAPGRPVLTFEISQPGMHRLVHPRRPADIAIVRDYVTGNEGRFAFAYSAQVVLVATPLAVIFGRRYLARRKARREAQRRRREEADALWRAMGARRRKGR